MAPKPLFYRVKKRLRVFKKLKVSDSKIKKLERDVAELKKEIKKEAFKTNSILATVFYRAGISQAQLADLTGKQENNISRWIHSKVQLSYKDFREIMSFLNYDTEIKIKKKSA